MFFFKFSTSFHLSALLFLYLKLLYLWHWFDWYIPTSLQTHCNSFWTQVNLLFQYFLGHTYQYIKQENLFFCFLAVLGFKLRVLCCLASVLALELLHQSFFLNLLRTLGSLKITTIINTAQNITLKTYPHNCLLRCFWWLGNWMSRISFERAMCLQLTTSEWMLLWKVGSEI
jgi:hypothetical protein